MPLAPDEVEDWRKDMNKLRPMFDMTPMTLAQHQAITALVPDRLPGVLAATVYLEGKIRRMKIGVTIPAIALLLLALAGGIALALR